MDSSETIFKRWAKENRLRLSTDEQGLPIVTRRGKRFQFDHLYEGFNAGIGLAVVRPSGKGIGLVMRHLQPLGITPKNLGRTEANFFVPWSKSLEVARMFKFVKGKPTGKAFKPRPEGRSGDQIGG